MKGFAIALVGLILLTPYLVAQSTNSNKSPHGPQQTPKHEQPNTPPPSPAQACTETANKPPANPPAKEKPERDWVDYVGLGLTAILAGTAIFGTCYALQTLKAIQHEAKIAVAALKQSGKLARASRVSADALTEAANAAGRHAEFARRATQNSERADVLIEAASFSPLNSSTRIDGNSRLHVTFKNFGRTRARDVQIRVRVFIKGVNLSKGVTELPISVMGPGQDQTVVFNPFKAFLDQKTFDGVAQGNIELWFEASADYWDIFGASYKTMDIGTFDPIDQSFAVKQKIAG